MPRVILPHTEITRTGVAPGAEVTADPANNHYTANDGNMFLLVRNSSGTLARVVTIVTPGIVDEQAVADRAISVPLGTSRYIGPFPQGTYGESMNVDVDDAELKLTAYHIV